MRAYRRTGYAMPVVLFMHATMASAIRLPGQLCGTYEYSDMVVSWLHVRSTSNTLMYEQSVVLDTGGVRQGSRREPARGAALAGGGEERRAQRAVRSIDAYLVPWL